MSLCIFEVFFGIAAPEFFRTSGLFANGCFCTLGQFLVTQLGKTSLLCSSWTSLHKKLGQKEWPKESCRSCSSKGANIGKHILLLQDFLLLLRWLCWMACEHFDASEALPAVPTVVAANELYAGVLVGKGGNFLRCELMLLLPSM